MEAVLFGLAVNVITWLAGKLKISKTYVSIWLSFVGGTVYYVMTNYYPVEWDSVVIFVGGVYATSQLIYNLLKKWGILEKISNYLNFFQK